MAIAPLAVGAVSGGGMSAGMGSAIGAGIGGGMGFLSDSQKKKEQEKQQQRADEERYPGGHRRMGQIMEALNAYREQKMAGQMALSQAAFSWADSLRL
jgi:hypothetical protein